MASDTITIGCGSAGSGDRLGPAFALANSGLVDYIGFDCLAERTLAIAQLRRLEDPAAGYDPQFPALVEGLAPFLARGGHAIGNFGAANPEAAVGRAADILGRLGSKQVRLGAVSGDDVRAACLADDVELPELDCRAGDVADSIVSAHAYIGAESVIDLLEQGAHLIIGGRLADPSLFVGPICHALGWSADDWAHLGHATLAGHLLECGMQVTGANYADPPHRVVPDMHDLSFPMATVGDGFVELTKLSGTGGAVDAMNTKLQLMYEVHDPASYLTPDVAADFSHVTVEEVGDDRVRLEGAGGSARPDQLKVLVGLDRGWTAVAEISYGGPGCVDRARLAAELMMRRLEPFHNAFLDRRVDLHGAGALFGDQLSSEPSDVRLRVAVRCADRTSAEAVAAEGTFLYFGPAGGGGASTTVQRAIGVTPAYLPRARVPLETHVVEV